MTLISYKDALLQGKVTASTEVLSYPDRKGDVYTGVVIEVNESANELRVSYKGYGNATLKLKSGRLMNNNIDTSLDVGMVWEKE